MITSVAQQTYPHWELCLAATELKPEIFALLDELAQQDARVRIRRLKSNLGIAENTNAALQFAQGEFVGFVDQDDLVAPFALHAIAGAIRQQPDADVIYTDEDRWSDEEERHSPFFKPDWSPELLYSCMYLGHLTVYRRTLVEELGGLRREFDLSQDYDLALRATEGARAIVHVPQVCYHWREHPASGNMGGKPEARRTNLAALQDAMDRRKLAAKVIEYSTANPARMALKSPPRVSIIVPTDSPDRARSCAVGLPRATDYPEFEILIVTNSALAAEIESLADRPSSVRSVRYDDPFNFSAKCNAGAEAARGDRLIFFNDDVTPQEADWIQNLIEPLENPEVGAVAPKMLYENGTIQHAGLVTGVRNLIGTAFHLLPHDSTEHVNFAQSMRDASALSGACLAIRRATFASCAGFDARELPIFHSDIDLCFKLRDAGMRCVYTPFATLRHIGHASLGEQSEPAGAKDKSDIYLLKRWAGYSAYDPYYPPNMRDWLYRDSPTPISIYGHNDSAPAATRRDVLLVTTDLGCNAEVYDCAMRLKNADDFVVVVALRDGPLREQISADNIPLIIDTIPFKDDGSFAKFSRNFDAAIGVTPESEPALRIAEERGVPVERWWDNLPTKSRLDAEPALQSR